MSLQLQLTLALIRHKLQIFSLFVRRSAACQTDICCVPLFVAGGVALICYIEIKNYP